MKFDYEEYEKASAPMILPLDEAPPMIGDILFKVYHQGNHKMILLRL